MDQSFNFPNQLSMQDVYRLAKSPAGQQLIALLQQQSGSDFRQVMDSASKGDYAQAKEALSHILADPQAQKLLKELGG